MDEFQTIPIGLPDVFCKDVVQFYAGQVVRDLYESLGEYAEAGSYFQDPVSRTYVRISDMAVGDTSVGQKILALALAGSYPCLGYEPTCLAHLSTNR